MAQLMSIKLSRFDASPWGFRLQGGKDFGQPLIIQKVNSNSPAEKAGLQAGDALIKINNVELFNLTHKDAQNAIVRAGNNFELTVQRGGSTWKPMVTPVGPTPTIGQTGNIQPVTKTSLAHKQQPPATSFNQYNYAPKPFGGSAVNGDPVKQLASKQYNCPIGLYSEETIKETLSAQAEVLAGGVVGVNFKKNEKTYNAANSEVLKMVQEIDNEPREPEPAEVSAPQTPKASNVPVSNPLSGLRHVSAPETKPQPAQDPLKVLPPGQNICADCERLIVGLFVRIKDKNLHVECFKCSTCGTSLKNVGYYNINNKLYCDVHAKMVARQNPPAPNLEPVTVPPGGKLPSTFIPNVSSGIPYQSQFSTSSTGPGSPQPGTIAPMPFHSPSSTVTAPKPALNQPSVPSPLTRPQSGIFSGYKPSPGLRGAGAGGARTGTFAGSSSPRRGKGILNAPNAARVPLCAHCNMQIRGPFISALGKIWCPEHFVCNNQQCRRPLADIGFVEEEGHKLYCEFCFEKYIAPNCDKCNNKIKGDCLNAIGKHFHPECFNCAYCGKLFGNSPFFLEDGLPYCESDWNELFTTKCFACGFPIEAGDRWVEALNNNYHSQCFNCTTCKTNLEGQSFFAKGGRPFCKVHARCASPSKHDLKPISYGRIADTQLESASLTMMP
ncbi:UNVERIFIED_CONTAM: hypothetical protein PYX00_008988 [Menopon gallinae]|uniref:PDZ and LIM domain protein Zasp n=2 Tax=Menopon gallinae TaxID=328185 RepID=A0AAW2H9K9_9NEOP